MTLPPVERPHVSCKNMVISSSRKLYGNERTKVEQVVAELHTPVKPPEGNKRDDRRGGGGARAGNAPRAPLSRPGAERDRRSFAPPEKKAELTAVLAAHKVAEPASTPSPSEPAMSPGSTVPALSSVRVSQLENSLPSSEPASIPDVEAEIKIDAKFEPASMPAAPISEQSAVTAVVQPTPAPQPPMPETKIDKRRVFTNNNSSRTQPAANPTLAELRAVLAEISQKEQQATSSSERGGRESQKKRVPNTDHTHKPRGERNAKPVRDQQSRSGNHAPQNHHIANQASSSRSVDTPGDLKSALAAVIAPPAAPTVEGTQSEAQVLQSSVVAATEPASEHPPETAATNTTQNVTTLLNRQATLQHTPDIAEVKRILRHGADSIPPQS